MRGKNYGYLFGVKTGFMEGRLSHVVLVNFKVGMYLWIIGEVDIGLGIRFDSGDGCMSNCVGCLVVGFVLSRPKPSEKGGLESLDAVLDLTDVCFKG